MFLVQRDIYICPILSQLKLINETFIEKYCFVLFKKHTNILTHFKSFISTSFLSCDQTQILTAGLIMSEMPARLSPGMYAC